MSRKLLASFALSGISAILYGIVLWEISYAPPVNVPIHETLLDILGMAGIPYLAIWIWRRNLWVSLFYFIVSLFFAQMYFFRPPDPRRSMDMFFLDIFRTLNGFVTLFVIAVILIRTIYLHLASTQKSQAGDE